MSDEHHGTPVATVALSGANNAGLLAIRILDTSRGDILQRLCDYQNGLREAVKEKVGKLQERYPCTFL